MTSFDLVKKELKSLDLDRLKAKKEQIAEFLLSFPNDRRSAQGWFTLDTLNELIESKEQKDNLKENVLKTMFFQD